MPVSMSRKSFLKCAAAFAAAPLPSLAESPVRKWYKGNLHMHTLVSDGRAFPVEAALSTDISAQSRSLLPRTS